MLQDLKGKVTGRGEITEVNMVTNFFFNYNNYRKDIAQKYRNNYEISKQKTFVKLGRLTLRERLKEALWALQLVQW